MKTSLLTYLFRRYPLEKAFQVCSTLGYDGIEIWGARPHAYPWDMDEAKIEDILRMKEQYSLEIPVYTAELLSYPYNICTQDEKERRETIAYLKKALEAGKAIGAEFVQAAFDHSGFGVTRKQNHENVVNVLKELCDHAVKVGIDLMVEPVTIWESNVGASVYDVLDIVEDVGCPDLKVMLDTATPFAHFEPFGEFLDLFGDRVVHVHFQDNDGISYAHLPLGDGCLPLEDVVAILQSRGYDRYLSVELIWPELRDPEIYARHSIRRLREIFESVGG